MLPEVGLSEMILIAVVALIVVGPKDLPVLMRRLGQMLGRLREMASEFRASFDDMARQSELDDLRREVEALRTGKPLYSSPETEARHAQIADVYSGYDTSGPAGEAPTSSAVTAYDEEVLNLAPSAQAAPAPAVPEVASAKKRARNASAAS